jgi:acyl-coenzyme A thioesterase PaaI-like protein
MSEPVAAHASNCFGCGPANSAGLGLELTAEGGDRLRGTITLDARHEGSPGIAHGGTVATILDDASGRFMYLTGEPAVTARLEVDYLLRVPIGAPLEVEAWIDSRNERGLEVRSELRERTTPLARAVAQMRFVDPAHFALVTEEPQGVNFA